MKKILFLLILATLFLSACGSTEVSGAVVNKLYEPERRWIQYLPMPVGKTFMLVPITHYDDEDFILVIYSEKDNRLINLYVDENTWNRFDKYDDILLPSKYQDDPIEKTRQE